MEVDGVFRGFVSGFPVVDDAGEDVAVGAVVIGRDEFGDGCERAEGFVEGDFFDGFGGDGVGMIGGDLLIFLQVRRGDLEAVEEQGGAAGVDLVAGDAEQDLADGELDGGTVFRQGQGEGGAAAAALERVGDRRAVGVVEVAKGLVAEAAAAAAAAVGEDVAALVLDGILWLWIGHVWGPPLPQGYCAKYSKDVS